MAAIVVVVGGGGAMEEEEDVQEHEQQPLEHCRLDTRPPASWTGETRARAT
jgi:hypothetical protein